MERKNYTLTELLTVIAIISLLAAIALPSLHFARQRARRTTCVSNQGQTMKIIANAMSNQKDRFYSGTVFGALSTTGVPTEKAAWSQYLAEKNYVQSVEVLRCTALEYDNPDELLVNANNIQQVFGVVVADDANKGIFNFAGTKLRLTSAKVEIPPSMMMIGACSAADATTKKATAKLDLSTNKIAGIHGEFANIFFLDGHADSFTEEQLGQNKYYPKADCSEAVQLTTSAWLTIP